MTPFEHLLAATEQRIAFVHAATLTGCVNDATDLGALVQDLCHSAVDSRDASAFDRMAALLARLQELEAVTRTRLEGSAIGQGGAAAGLAGSAPQSLPGGCGITA